MIDVVKFWENQGERIFMADMPDAICNGFMLDLGNHLGNHHIGERVTYTIKKNAYSFNLDDFTLPLYLKSEGREQDWFIPAEEVLYLYRYETIDGQHVYLQKQYCEYFRRVYPGCEFMGQDDPDKPVAVMVGNEIVGAIATVMSDIKYHVKRQSNES